MRAWQGRGYPGFYPRHPRGWRHKFPLGNYKTIEVSIHATLAGGDLHPYHRQDWTQAFLSTPPSRVATGKHGKQGRRRYSFYPRHPRGWRLDGITIKNTQKEFLSTPPSRVATRATRAPLHFWLFLSTPPSRVATRSGSPCWWTRSGFYPRHPRGWRPEQVGSNEWGFGVSIHATLAGGDTPPSLSGASHGKFLSTPPSRVATTAGNNIIPRIKVSIHATLAGGDV